MSAFRKLSIATLAATFVLIGIGGLVNATKSGLGCGDDWPDCNGRLAPALETRAEIIEFSHRAAAGVVIVLLGLLMIVAIKNHRSERYILWPTIGAFFFVLGQAALGAAVVFLHLKASTVTAHLAMALTLLALLIYLVRATAVREGSGGPGEFRDRTYMRQAGGAALATLFLLLVGSYVSGRGAGMAFPDWPLMNGRVIPDLSDEAQGIHFLHRALAGIVGVIVLITGLRLVKLKAQAPLVARLAHIAMGLFAIEIFIGALNVWTELNSVAVSAHLAIGALIWGSLVGVTVSLHPGLDRLGESARRERSQSPILEGGR